MRRRYRRRLFCDDPEYGYGPGPGYGDRRGFGYGYRAYRHGFHHGPGARFWGYGPWFDEPEADTEDLRGYVADLESIIKGLQDEIAGLKSRLS